ncbi:MAG: aminotransferase class III-fold pyridoxal phosphate-dependent enzyme [Candidatus Omnitrophica bacterium]|nr:aminotransferase class III-fold pyridoxal phosphate-dependent enzyme [Candidatus Omnitrophota bacterium]
MNQDAGQKLYRKAKSLIPGGTQLLSKRPEMFLPDLWPSYFSKAKGVEVWDLEGRRYVDMCYNGIGACILGAADPDVNEAVIRAVHAGVMSTLNCPEEVELAEHLCELHPWADMVRYARSGGEAMAVAVRIARAKTRRDKIAFCGYHGWHDWYLAANLAEDDALDGHLLPGLDPLGVPRGLQGTALPFHYNRIDELEDIVRRNCSQMAAIVMEPIRNVEPDPGFWKRVREIADENHLVLVIDEITAGFRLNTGGAHLGLDISPDIAVFGKGMSNGYPMAAVIGRSEIMQAAQSTFISSTYWTERVGPAAALAVIQKHGKKNVSAHLDQIGRQVKECWRAAADRSGMPIHIGGINPLAHFSFECEQSQVAHTCFTQLMLEQGFLATKAFYATFAHRDEHVQAYQRAVESAFSEIALALQQGVIHEKLKGPVAHSGFQRLT